MDKDKKKKSRRRKVKRPTFRKHSINGSMMGGASRWTRPPPIVPRRDYSYRTVQKQTPRQERSHWNGRVQMWTEPQKPRQEKIVKYEVDTDKLLRELAKGNKDALNEIAEKLKEEKTETSNGEKDAENLQRIDSEKTEADSAETEPNKSDESSERSVEETEIKTEANEDSEEKTETNDEAKGDQTETVEKAEVTQENQEMPQDIESETESSQQEDPLDAPELVYMNPSFWEQLESEMSDELEQLEPEEEFEISPEESEPIEASY